MPQQSSTQPLPLWNKTNWSKFVSQNKPQLIIKIHNVDSQFDKGRGVAPNIAVHTLPGTYGSERPDFETPIPRHLRSFMETGHAAAS